LIYLASSAFQSNCLTISLGGWSNHGTFRSCHVVYRREEAAPVFLEPPLLSRSNVRIALSSRVAWRVQCVEILCDLSPRGSASRRVRTVRRAEPRKTSTSLRDRRDRRAQLGPHLAARHPKRRTFSAAKHDICSKRH